MRKETTFPRHPCSPHPHNNFKRPPCCLIHSHELSIIALEQWANLFRKHRFSEKSPIPAFSSSLHCILASGRSLWHTTGPSKWPSTACHRDENVGRSKSRPCDKRRGHYFKRDHQCDSIAVEPVTIIEGADKHRQKLLISFENFLCEINKAVASTFLATIILFCLTSSGAREDRKRKRTKEKVSNQAPQFYILLGPSSDATFGGIDKEQLEKSPLLLPVSDNKTLTSFSHNERSSFISFRHLLELILAMDSLCERIDQLTLAYLEEFGQLLACKQFIDDTMKNGYFNLSRARIIMGVNNLSRMQYSEDQLMTASTKISVQSSPTFEIEKQHDQEHANDPLNLFGLLHTRVWKQSQKSFQQTIDLALEACQRQENVRRLRTQIDSLMKEQQSFSSKENLHAKKLVD